MQTFGIESPELGDLLVPDGLMSQKVATYANDPGVSTRMISHSSELIPPPMTRFCICRPRATRSGSPSERVSMILYLQVLFISSTLNAV